MTTSDGRLGQWGQGIRHRAGVIQDSQGWRDLRQAARVAQVAAGLAILVNLACIFLIDGTTPSRSPVLWALNYLVICLTFTALSGGFFAERRAERKLRLQKEG